MVGFYVMRYLCTVCRLFEETDEDGGGTVDSDELFSLLVDLGMDGVTMEQVESIIQTYDVDGSSALGLDEFQVFLKQQAIRAKIRLNDLTMDPFLALAGSPEERYVPSKTGFLCLDVCPGLDPKENIPALSACDRVQLFEAALSTVDHVKMIRFAIQGVKLRLEEAQSIYYKLLPDLRDKSEVVKMVLPFIINTTDTIQFISQI